MAVLLGWVALAAAAFVQDQLARAPANGWVTLGVFGRGWRPGLGIWLEVGAWQRLRRVEADLGTFAGLRGNGDAQVLDERGEPIPGLYATGNDLASIMGGNYPGGGITLGPALTFGWIAARHMAQDSTGRQGAELHQTLSP